MNKYTPIHDPIRSTCTRIFWQALYARFVFAAWDYRSLPMTRSAVKRTNSEPTSIALQVFPEQNRANRSHGDLNSVDRKCNSEIPAQFTNKSGASGDSCSTSSSTSSPPSSPLPTAGSATNSASLSAQEELDQFPGSHFSFSGWWTKHLIHYR